MSQNDADVAVDLWLQIWEPCKSTPQYRNSKECQSEYVLLLGFNECWLYGCDNKHAVRRQTTPVWSGLWLHTMQLI